SLYRPFTPRSLPSFPTRRSSDLATRVPSVVRYVAEVFGQTPLADIDPDQVVALGAAVQADLLAGQGRSDDILLLDVIPLSLGIEDRKSTRLNSSHVAISYAVFCL